MTNFHKDISDIKNGLSNINGELYRLQEIGFLGYDLSDPINDELKKLYRFCGRFMALYDDLEETVYDYEEQTE